MSTLLELLPLLRDQPKVIVTGPQRSGTTIAAKILAHDLGRPFLPEEKFDVIDLSKFFRLFDKMDCFVIQAPALCSFAHALPGCVVLMRRPVEQIMRSQTRINWSDIHEPEELLNYFTTLGPIACVKYFTWDVYQKRKLGERAQELEYESLRGHPLWVHEESRKNFGPRQTEDGGYFDPSVEMPLRPVCGARMGERRKLDPLPVVPEDPASIAAGRTNP